MDAFHSMALGLGVALQPINLFFCFVGVFVGTLIGVLPGIGPVGTMSLLLPRGPATASSPRRCSS